MLPFSIIISNRFQRIEGMKYFCVGSGEWVRLTRTFNYPIRLHRMKRLVLLNPGPINVTERVQKALWRGDLCHREEESSRLMGQIRRKLTEAFGINQEYTAVLISGSGTAALEMSISSSLSPGKSILVIQNGVYGERIAKIAEIYQFKKHVLNYP